MEDFLAQEEAECIQRAAKKAAKEIFFKPVTDGLIDLSSNGMIISDIAAVKELTHQYNIKSVIGYWRGKKKKSPISHGFLILPWPEDFIDEFWSAEEAKIVAEYLGKAPEVEHWRGYSSCRLCGIMNGSTDKSDGSYIWPQGFAHYVKEHKVKPPEEFLVHIGIK
jgi:hypothetical protein